MIKPKSKFRKTIVVVIAVFIFHFSLSHLVLAKIGEMYGTEIGKFATNLDYNEGAVEKDWELTKTAIKEKLSYWGVVGSTLSFPVGFMISSTGNSMAHGYVIEPLSSKAIDVKAAYRRLYFLGYAELILNSSLIAFLSYVVLTFVQKMRARD